MYVGSTVEVLSTTITFTLKLQKGHAVNAEEILDPMHLCMWFLYALAKLSVDQLTTWSGDLGYSLLHTGIF